MLQERSSSGLLVGAAAAAAAGASLYWLLGRRGQAAGAPGPTDFESYLRSAPEQPRAFAATSFEAYLRGPAGNSTAGPAPAAQPPTAASAVPADRAPVTVLFGTEYGFSKEIAEKLAARLQETGAFWWVLVGGHVQRGGRAGGRVGGRGPCSPRCACPVPLSIPCPPQAGCLSHKPSLAAAPPLGPRRPRLLDMAEHPEGLPLGRHQALLVVCSTQGDGVPPGEAREFCDWLGSAAAPALAGLHFSVCALGDRCGVEGAAEGEPWLGSGLL